MNSDSIPNASIAMASSHHKDFPKKKKVNRSAKLKQCKLDARREQWLSQVKNKNQCKEEMYGGGDTPAGPMHSKNENERGITIKKVELKPSGEEEVYGDGSTMHHFSDVESFPSNSPTSHTSSVLGGHDSGTNFTASSRGSSSSGRSSSNGSHCFFSGSMSGEDEENVGDDECLDDWEAVADALAATDNNQQEHNPNSGLRSPSSKKPGDSAQESNFSDAKQESGGTTVKRNSVKNRAWKADDVFRPLGLPNLSKQNSFPLNSERHFGCGVSVWGCKNGESVPIPCPICCEDLDGTDLIFNSCSCGFTLCLFCHDRIFKENGRCPGCRKQYDSKSVEREAKLNEGSFAVRLARSYSMIARS